MKKSFGLGHDTAGIPTVDKGGIQPWRVCTSTSTSGAPTPTYAAHDAAKGVTSSKTPWLYLDSQHESGPKEHDEHTHRG